MEKSKPIEPIVQKVLQTINASNAVSLKISTGENINPADLVLLLTVQNAMLQELLQFLTTKNTEKPSEPTAEEKERKRSLVIHGLKEPQIGTLSAKAKQDQETIYAIMDEIEAEAVPVAIYRLPEKIDDPNRPRLLKVVLANSGSQRTVLDNAKKLNKIAKDHIRKFVDPEKLFSLEILRLEVEN